MSVFKTLKQNSFLKHNAIFFAGALLVSLLNYLYYPIIGRLLNLSQFGEVQVLVSLFTQLTLGITVLGQVVVTIVANHEDQQTRTKILANLYRFTLLASVALFIVGVAGSWWLKEVLQFDSIWPFIILLLTLVATVPVTFVTSYLRGQKKFGSVSLANIIGAGGKLVGSALFVLIGWGTAGAIGGLIAAQVAALGFVWGHARRQQFMSGSLKTYWQIPDIKSLWPELQFSGFVLVASLGVAVLSSIDVLLVKAFFAPDLAGGYAGVSTVAKIIFFLTASVAQVMLPSIKSHVPKAENRRYLIKSFLLIAALGGSVLLSFVCLPQFVVTTLMGSNFASYAHLLPALSLASFLLAVINLLVFYYIALRKYSMAGVVGAGVLLTTILLFINHQTLQQVATMLFIGCFGLCLLFALWRGALLLKGNQRA